MDKTKETVLVTGANGFVAIFIIKKLLEEGYRVRGSVRSLLATEKYQHLLDLSGGKFKDALDFVELDIYDEFAWDAAVRGCKYVVHVAAPRPSNDPPEA